MITVNSAPPKNIEQHDCEAHRDGDWIIYKCPRCQDYERKYNWRTGSMKVSGGNENIAHSGRYIPNGAVNGFNYLN